MLILATNKLAIVQMVELSYVTKIGLFIIWQKELHMGQTRIYTSLMTILEDTCGYEPYHCPPAENVSCVAVSGFKKQSFWNKHATSEIRIPHLHTSSKSVTYRLFEANESA